MATRSIKRNDTKVTPWARFLDEDGTPINLTGVTVVYTLQDRGTGLNKVDRAAATVRDQTTWPGEAFFQFEPEDIDTAMDAEEEWELTYTDGLKESFPVGESVLVTIQADLDAV